MLSPGNRPSAEEKLSRKRYAARLRQQACRARKRQMFSHMSTALAKAVAPNSPEMSKKSSFLHGSATSPNNIQEPIQLVSPPSTQELFMEKFPHGTQEYYNVYHKAFGLMMPMIPYSSLVSTVTPFPSNDSLCELISSQQVHLEPEPKQPPALDQQLLLLRHVDYYAHPPAKQIFAQRATHRQANEIESTNIGRQGSACYKVRTTLPLSCHSLERHHRRSLSDFDRIEAVTAILSLKSSRPVY